MESNRRRAGMALMFWDLMELCHYELDLILVYLV
jgi:hypothetical protein